MFSDKFNAVMITVYQREGGECNLVGDSGGWTFRGIAQNYWGTKYKNIFDRLKVCKDKHYVIIFIIMNFGLKYKGINYQNL